jgi:hypothetical protein
MGLELDPPSKNFAHAEIGLLGHWEVNNIITCFIVFIAQSLLGQLCRCSTTAN